MYLPQRCGSQSESKFSMLLLELKRLLISKKHVASAHITLTVKPVYPS
jgi:hypothetical protein